MNYKLLTCLLCILVLSPMRATIYKTLKPKAPSDRPANSSAERFATIEDIPDEIGNIIAQRILKDNPKINESAKTFKVLQDRTENVNSVAWSPDGTEIIVKTAKFVQKVSVITGKIITGYNCIYEDDIRGISFNFDKTHFATFTEKKICIFDVKTDESVKILSVDEAIGNTSIASIAWSPDGVMLVVFIENGDVAIYDTSTWTVIRTLNVLFRNNARMTFSSDGTKIVFCSSRKCGLFDTTTWQPLQEIPITGCTNMIARPNSTQVIILQGNVIHILDTVTGQISMVKDGFFINSAAWNTDGTRLASAPDGQIVIRDAMYRPINIIKNEKLEKVTALAWSPDDTQLFCGLDNLAGISSIKTHIIFNLYLLGTTDIENITLQQALLLKLLYAKRPTYAYARMKPIDFNVPLHDKLPVKEAKQILSTFSDEAKNRIIKRYNIVEYTSSPKREIDANAEKSPRIRHHSGAAASSSGYIEDAMDRS